MKYGNFEYRVVYNKLDGFSVMQLFEMDGKYYFISKSSSIPHGNSLLNLKTNLLLFIAAFDKPALMFEDIKEMTTLLPK